MQVQNKSSSSDACVFDPRLFCVRIFCQKTLYTSGFPANAVPVPFSARYLYRYRRFEFIVGFDYRYTSVVGQIMRIHSWSPVNSCVMIPTVLCRVRWRQTSPPRFCSSPATRSQVPTAAGSQIRWVILLICSMHQQLKGAWQVILSVDIWYQKKDLEKLELLGWVLKWTCTCTKLLTKYCKLLRAFFSIRIWLKPLR